jgi:hypothetical protein
LFWIVEIRISLLIWPSFFRSSNISSSATTVFYFLPSFLRVLSISFRISLSLLNCAYGRSPLGDVQFRMIFVSHFCSADAEVLQRSEIVKNESIEGHRVSSSVIWVAYS